MLPASILPAWAHAPSSLPSASSLLPLSVTTALEQPNSAPPAATKSSTKLLDTEASAMRALLLLGTGPPSMRVMSAWGAAGAQQQHRVSRAGMGAGRKERNAAG